MEAPEFKEFAKEMIDFIVNYSENIRDRHPAPAVEPGYLRALVPSTAPQHGESWQEVMADVERVIMPGMMNWQSPRFFGYFPLSSSYPAILGDMLCGALSGVGCNWNTNPACTELEVVTMDWLGKMLDLPAEFLASSGGKGGGVIQGTASESTLVALLGAKAKVIHRIKQENPSMKDDDIVTKLVFYHSDQAHCSVARAGLLGGVKLHSLQTDEKRKLRGDVLQKAIDEDKAAGFIPFYVVATLGTTSSCAFDPLDELGEVTNKEGIWLHVDAAYAGAAFICPEFRYLMKGVELVDSFNFNPHKWLLVNFDCSAMWLKDPSWFENAYKLEPPYLKYDKKENAIDYRHWQIPFGRRFRSLKLWFVLRLYGVANLQEFIRKQVGIAHVFEDLCRKDDRFEIVEEVVLGLVCFRLKGPKEYTEELHKLLLARRNIFLVSSSFGDTFFLRLAICSQFIEKEDIVNTWKEISHCADQVLKSGN